MISLKKSDFLFLIYFLLTSVLILAGWSTAIDPIQLLLGRTGVLLGIGGVLYLDRRYDNKVLRLLRWSYPVMLSGFFYQETVYYNKLFFNDLDWVLVEADQWIFGCQPSILFSGIFPQFWFSELMYFAYFSFYMVIVGFIIYMFFTRPDLMGKAIFYLAASLYFFYLIFAILPAAGPQFFFSGAEGKLPDAWFFDKVMHAIQRELEQPTGAFPSSHIGGSLAILVLARKMAPSFFKGALPIVILLILSTVYIKAHYVVDVIGAVIILPLVFMLSNILYRRLPGAD